MTTPVGDPLPIPVGATPQLICPPLQGTQVFIQNTDTQANVFIGRNPGITQTNTLMLAPGAGSVWDASRATYAFTDSATPPVTVFVSPGTSQYTLGPQQIVDTLDVTALALAIGEAIAAGGVPLLASPQLLYSLPTTVTQPGGTLVGATIGANNYPGTTQSQADAKFDGYVGRNMAVTAQKMYANEGQLASALPSTDMTGAINDGAAVMLSAKPCHTASGTYSDSTVCTNGKTCLQEKNNLTSILNNFLAAGLVAGTSFKVVLWQECNTTTSPFPTPTSYQHYVAYYGPAVRALGIPLVYNPAINVSEVWDGFTGYVGDANCDEIAVDLYASGYSFGFTMDGTGRNDQGSYVALAANHSGGPVPIGIIEFNDVAGGGAGDPTNWPPLMTYLTGVFNNVVNAGHPLGWLIFWMGNNAVGKPNNQILSSSDYKIPALQAFYDTFSQAPSTTTVAAGATVTLLPISPFPTTKLAIADSLGYELTLGLVAGVGSTIPFATIIMDWYAAPNTNNNPIASQHWSCPMGTAGTAGTIIKGRGPQYGAYLRIRVANLDSVTCSLSLQLNSNGRPIARDDWQWDCSSSVSVPTYTLATGGADYGNQLGSVNALSIPANGSLSRLFGMFSGPVSVRFAGQAGGFMDYLLQPVPTQRFGTQNLINEVPTSEFVFSPLYLPRGPVLVTMTNSDGASAHNASVEITTYD